MKGFKNLKSHMGSHYVSVGWHWSKGYSLDKRDSRWKSEIEQEMKKRMNKYTVKRGHIWLHKQQ